MACKPTNVLNIVYYNARSLLPKLNDLHLIAESVSPDVICIVETWLCGDISDSEIALQGYLVHRADRNRHGGGVLIYTKDSFVCNVLNPHDSLEIITLSIRTGVNKACFSLFYRPPASPIELLDDLFLYLESIQFHYFCNNYIFTRCAYAQGRVKRLSPSIYLFVCVCVDVCVVKKHGCLLSYRSKIATK